MKLPEEAIDEFMRVYQDEFNKPLERAKAEELAENLIRLFELILNHKSKLSDHEITE